MNIEDREEQARFALADVLAERLRERFDPQGHDGFGGED